MPILVSCECGKRLQVRDDLAGKRAKCPGCARIVTVRAAPPARARPPISKLAVVGGVLVLLSAAGFLATRLRGGEPAPQATAKVEIDNVSDAEWTLWIDGQEAGRVPPKTIRSFPATPGAHDLRITAGGGELDRGQATLEENKVALFNPGGRATYVLYSVTYGIDIVFYAGPPGASTALSPSTDVLAGRQFITSNCGLVEKLPEDVATEGGSIEGRTKLYRQAPDPFTVPEAIAYLTQQGDGPYYRQGGSDEAATRACLALAAARGNPQADQLVLRQLRNPDGLAVEALLRVAPELADRLTDDGLLALLRSTTMGPTERVAAAARTLIARGRGDRLAQAFASLPVYNQIHILQTMREGPAASRAQVLCAGFGSTNPDMVREATALVVREDFPVDEALAKEFEALIDRAQTDEQRVQLRSGLWNLLRGAAARLPSDYAVPRLVEAAREGWRYGLEALVRAGHGARLAPELPGLDLAARNELYDALRLQVENRQAVDDSDAALLIAFASDEDPRLSESATGRLCDNAPSRPDLARAAAARIERETNPAARTGMEQRISNAAFNAFKSSSPEARLEVVVGDAPRPIRHGALRALLEDAAQLGAIRERFAALDPADRAWLLSSLWGLRRPAMDAELRPIFAAGLADAEAAVRAESIRPMMALTTALGPEMDLLDRAIQEQEDARAKERLAAEFRGWLLPMLAESPDREVNRWLAVLAAAPEDHVADEAWRRLQVNDETAGDLVPLVAELFRGAEYASKREEILRKVEDVRHAAVVALFREALADDVTSVRLLAFETLVRMYQEDVPDARSEATRDAIEEAARSERIRSAKQRMEELLATLGG